jgi:hypothetical protein
MAPEVLAIVDRHFRDFGDAFWPSSPRELRLPAKQREVCDAVP